MNRYGIAQIKEVLSVLIDIIITFSKMGKITPLKLLPFVWRNYGKIKELIQKHKEIVIEFTDLSEDEKLELKLFVMNSFGTQLDKMDEIAEEILKFLLELSSIIKIIERIKK